MMKRFILILSVFCFSVSMFGLTNWTGNVNTDWFNPGNWDNGLPGPGNDAIIPTVPIGGLFPEINAPVIQNYQIDNRGVITIEVGGSITNSNLFINRVMAVVNIAMAGSSFVNTAGGTLNNFGAVANSGLLTNTGGTITNQANAGIGNFSQMFNSNNGTITNSGTFSNLGTVSNMALIVNWNQWMVNTGLINNNGNFLNQGTGALTVNPGAEFRNNDFFLGAHSSNTVISGLFSNNAQVVNQQSSIITINPTGVLNNSVTILNNVGAQILNNGLINNFFCALINTFGTITNFSTINNSGIIQISPPGTLSPNQPNDIGNGVTFTSGNPSGICVNISRALDGVGTPIVVAATDLVNPMIPLCAGYSVNVNGANSVVFDCSNFGVNTVNVTIITPLSTINCTAEVTITDPHPAQPACKPAVINIPANGVATVTPGDVFAGGFDNCGIINLVSVTPNQFFCAQLGNHTVTLNVNDGHGNMSSCNAQVTIVDQTPPMVTCQNASVILDANGMGSIMPSDVVAMASDNCGIMSTHLSQDMFDCNDVPSVNVTVTVTDHSGMQASCMATVTVTDDMAPVIGCQPQLQGVSSPGLCGTNLSPDPPLILAENCGIASITNDHPSSFYAVGVTIVTWTVTDNSGNSSTCTQEVVVWDKEDPSITCNSLVLTAYDVCTFPGNIVEMQPPFVDDNCGIATVIHNAPPSFGPGNHVVIWTAYDVNGNHAYCEQWVKVMDPVAPVLNNCPGDIEVNTNSNSANVNWNPPTASDNCGSPEITSSHNPGDEFGLGETEVTYCADDGNGNETCCSFTVTVKDGAAPIIEGGPEDAYLLVENCSDEAIIEWEEPVITDAGGFDLEIEGGKSGDDFEPGTTTITYIATDQSGNETTFSFNVTVETSVEVFCPQDIYASGSANIAWNELLPQTVCEDCPSEVDGYRLLGWYNGHQYYVSDDIMTWTEAQEAAELNGGHLVVINDSEENAFLAGFMSPTTPAAWIGVQVNDGEAYWVNGDDADYLNWLGGAPSENEEKNAGLLRMGGFWINEDGEILNRSIIEFPCFEINPGGDAGNGTDLGEGEYNVTYDVTDMCGYTCECSFNINVVPEGEVVEYCSTAGVGGPSIQMVKIGNQAHSSGDDDGYGDFTDYTFVIQEQECVIELIPAGYNPDDILYWKVWVDLNQDGDFYDFGELLTQVSGQGPLSVVHKFALPLPLDGTRMRVICSEDGYVEVCGDFHNGEVEDFTIRYEENGGGEFNGGTVNNGQNDGDLTLYPNPANSFIYVNTLSYEGMPTTVRVFNSLGQQMHLFNTQSMDVNYKLNLEDYNEGVYTIVIEAEGVDRQSKTFVVSK